MISEFEPNRHEAFRKALLEIAQFYFISDAQRKSVTQLYDEILLLQTPLMKYIQDYFEAYNRWYNFYNGKGREGAGLTPDERMRVAELIADCHKKKVQLQTRFTELKNNKEE